MKLKNIAIIGLGYVGLPLAVEFGRHRRVIGFDISAKRVEELNSFFDKTLECSEEQIKDAKYLTFTKNIDDVRNCEIFIITVPTPIDEHRNPDLQPLHKATEMVGNILKPRDIVIYESTVYPGATEETCVPILEQCSKLRFNKSFFCGYSPERINPGDKNKNLTEIKKIVSGSNYEIAQEINELYSQIIKAGTFLASSIKVAEAAKVIENTQRDINIALINELSIIFNIMDIDINEVLEAAETKWNFIPFKPGLVGGHCIGVDPYYLTYKSLQVGYSPELILSGRRINDHMPIYVAHQVNKKMLQKEISILNSNILLMGLTFKEDCPDIRNTKSFDLLRELVSMKANVEVFDPWVKKENEDLDPRIHLVQEPNENYYDAIVIAVGHSVFKGYSYKKLCSYGKKTFVLYDLKNIYKNYPTDGSL